MRRRVVALDRAAVLLVGLVLVAAGVAAAWWWSGREVAGTRLTGTLQTDAVTDLTTASWWTWALTGAAVVLLALGLWWFTAHLRRHTPAPLRLGEPDGGGALLLPPDTLADAVLRRARELPGVDAARGGASVERGRTVLRLQVTVAPGTDLPALARSLDRLTSELAAMVPAHRFAVGIAVHVARPTLRLTSSTPPRTHPVVS